MTMEDRLNEYVKQLLAEQGEDVEVETDDDLVMIGFDSIAYVRLIAHIRAEHGLTVPDSDVTVEQFGTVGRIASYLESRGVGLDQDLS